jgi:hypothetical protein
MKFRSDHLAGCGQLDSGLNKPTDAGVLAGEPSKSFHSCNKMRNYPYALSYSYLPAESLSCDALLCGDLHGEVWLGAYRERYMEAVGFGAPSF